MPLIAELIVEGVDPRGDREHAAVAATRVTRGYLRPAMASPVLAVDFRVSSPEHRVFEFCFRRRWGYWADMDVERLTDSIAGHGEGPVWSAAWGGLRWVDMTAGDVLSFGEDGSVSRIHVGTVAAAVRPRDGGGAVVAVERGFLLESADGTTTSLSPLWSDPDIRMNEGGCAPDGSFYCGSMAYDKQPGAASLYRLDPDHSVTVVLTGVTCPTASSGPRTARWRITTTPTLTASTCSRGSRHRAARSAAVRFDSRRG